MSLNYDTECLSLQLLHMQTNIMAIVFQTRTTLQPSDDTLTSDPLERTQHIFIYLNY